MAIENLRAERAKFAFERVLGKNNEYKIAVKKLVPLIQCNGLIAAMEFYKGKGEEMRKVYDDVSAWLQKRGFVELNKDLILCLLHKDSLEVFRITDETKDFLGWLKRMADGEIHS